MAARVKRLTARAKAVLPIPSFEVTDGLLRAWLPYPPTLNRYYRHAGGKVLISREGREYRGVVVNTLRLRVYGIPPLSGRLSFTVDVYPPDARRRDLDNLQKGLLDSLKYAGAYHDDSQIDELHIRRMGVVPGGKVVVRVEEIAPCSS